MSGKLIHKLKRKRAEIALQSERHHHHHPTPTVEPGNRSSQAPRKKAKMQPTHPAAAAETPPSPSRHEVLAEALRKVQALQAELAALDDVEELDYDSGNEEEENDLMAFEAEALGFAACARETLTFLAAQGLARDNPLVLNLRSRLVGKCSGLPI